MQFHELINNINEKTLKNGCREITFQITDDCCCACSYCYQTNKGKRYMTKETGKRIVDLLFQMYEEDDKTKPITNETPGIVLEFIGGEPLMNIELIDYICTYFFDRCLETDHQWLLNSKIMMISNGALYFNKDVQSFLEKFKGLVQFDVTLDGPQHIHDACRKYHNGEGNFADAYAAFQDLKKKNDFNHTKITISPENLHSINESIQFFINEGVTNIHANPAYEPHWTIQNAQDYYIELKKMANILLQHKNVEVTLFDEQIGQPKFEDDLASWCGGASTYMLAFDPEGNAYPCIRYMDSSLNGSRPPLKIGDYNGIYNTKESKKIREELLKVNRRTQSTDECFYCPIANGCADCSAWNYQESGKLQSKSMNICIMHKARVLANCYYWNMLYRQDGRVERFKLNLSEEEILKIISKEEYDLLKNLTAV